MVESVCRIKENSFTMRDEFYNHYYLPLLGRDPRNRGQRPKIPTAFVEFCDLEKPESTEETPREYHNQFKPSTLYLPKIQRKSVRHDEYPCQNTPSCPTVPIANYHIPYTFTEGLSSFSAPKPPLMTLQRTIPSANLPKDIRVSEERKKDYFVVERREFQEATPRRAALATACIPLVKREETQDENNVFMKKQSNEQPYLKFAPNVLYDKRPEKKVSHQNDRSLSPYNQKRPNKLPLVPKEIPFADVHEMNPYHKRSIGNYYEQEISRLREKKSHCGLSPSCVLGVAGVAKTKLELPFTILREKRVPKTNLKPHVSKINLKNSDITVENDPPVSNTTRFVIKIPTTTESVPRCISDALSEVAQLNTNNSNINLNMIENKTDINQGEFPIEDTHEYDSFIINSMDETRLMSVEPDLDEQDQCPLPTNINDCEITQKDTPKNNVETDIDVALRDEDTPFTETGECLEEKPSYNLKEHEVTTTTPLSAPEEPEVKINGSSDVNNDIETPVDPPKARKLRLEVRILRTFENCREVSTQMYYT